ncbi:hypothetical protein CEXT_351391 [Caerostris extrusa]|uniref:Uncharacterized protein n=1 Tax=Caerostris extrusa TaxID=172846 RepID=A0AAV4RKF0_CAEEX|nr:hypothetical protein CEXT_351391 [Caerostris extrusa]
MQDRKTAAPSNTPELLMPEHIENDFSGKKDSAFVKTPSPRERIPWQSAEANRLSCYGSIPSGRPALTHIAPPLFPSRMPRIATLSRLSWGIPSTRRTLHDCVNAPDSVHCEIPVFM